MRTEISKKNRRIWVTVNYLSIILLLVFFYAGEGVGWNLPIIFGLIASLAVALITFIPLHIKTNLWKLVHTKVEKLDEREIQVIHESLRYSYSIFTVTCLAIILYYTLTRGAYTSGAPLILASLIYLAHTLPSSIIAWTEKEI